MNVFLRQFAQDFVSPNEVEPHQARHKPEQLGYDDYFFRLWEFYLCYCEGGFIERTIGTAQLLPTKPAAQPEPLLGKFDFDA